MDIFKAIKDWQENGTYGPWFSPPEMMGDNGGSKVVAGQPFTPVDVDPLYHVEVFGDTSDAVEHDAALIAAAPDMAKALLAAVELADAARPFIPRCDDNRNCVYSTTQTVEEMIRFRDAVVAFRKATGEAQ